MPHNPRVSYGTAALIRRDDGKLLMLRRKSRHEHGRWSVPGGWVDLGEKPENAVVREVAEEVGLEVIDKDFFRWVTSVHNEGTPEALQSLTLHFAVRTWKGEAKNLEPDKCFEIAWLDPVQVLEDPSIQGLLFPGLDYVIRQARLQLWV